MSRSFVCVKCVVGVLLGAALYTPLAHANPVKADHVTVSLVARESALVPGGPLLLGVFFKLEPEWHIYWRNPGDSGQAPRFDWKLPAGLTPGEIIWPIPHTIRTGPLLNYGYEGEVLLPVPVHVPAELPPEVLEGEEVRFSVTARWLVCREDCIPGKAELALALPVRPEAAPANAQHAARFAAVTKEEPTPIQARVSNEGTHLLVELPPVPAELGPDARYTFFPFESLVISHPAPQIFARTAQGATLRLQKDEMREDPLVELAGLVVAEGKQKRQAFLLRTEITGAAGAALAGSDVPGRGEGALAVGAAPDSAPRGPGLFIVLLFAFVGGLLLNLMPCVFPVLSLKILGVARHGHDPRAARRDGWAYTAGVVSSLSLLAGVLLVLRAGSARFGWGFQLQSPAFVAILALVMLLMALNLLGTFEIGLGLTRLGSLGGLTPGGAARTPRQALVASFVTGVLAVVVATPCTAPFMGTALGFALTQPPGLAMSVFVALALGLAAPYAALGYFPRLLARMPRPGAWMQILRRVLAFPLLGTVIWLLAIYAQLSSELAVWRLMAALLVIAFGAWIYGQYQESERRPPLALVGAVVIGLAGFSFGAHTLHGEAEFGVRRSRAVTAIENDKWEAWSHARVAELRAQGRPVFVNFTAAWCISCKANELMVFQDDEVRAAFAERNVAMLKADWTHPDEEIARELARHGRAGVPLYLYYAPGTAGPPELLPAVLTKGIVLAALSGGGARR